MALAPAVAAVTGRLWGRKTNDTFYGSPYLDQQNSRWSVQHTENGNYNDRQKYGHQGHPLQKEDGLRSMEDFGQRSGEYARSKVATAAQTAALSGQAPKANALALELYKGELANERAKHNAMFVHDFTEWLRGAGKPEEYYKAGYYSYLKCDANKNFLDANGAIIGRGDQLSPAQQRRMVKDTRKVGKPVSYAPDVLAYLSKKQDRVIDYERERAKMRNRQGRMGKSGADMSMDASWKYFKHWVKGLNDSSELDDAISEYPPEYDSRLKQNDKVKIAIDQQQAAAVVESQRQEQVAGLGKLFETHMKMAADAQQQTNALLERIAVTPAQVGPVDSSALQKALDSLNVAQKEKTGLQELAANQAITMNQVAAERDAIKQRVAEAQAELERMRTEGKGVMTQLGGQIVLLQQQLAEGENLSRTERANLNKQVASLQMGQLAALNEARDQAGQIKALNGELTGTNTRLAEANQQALVIQRDLQQRLDALSEERTAIALLQSNLKKEREGFGAMSRAFDDVTDKLSAKEKEAKELAASKAQAETATATIHTNATALVAQQQREIETQRLATNFMRQLLIQPQPQPQPQPEPQPQPQPEPQPPYYPPDPVPYYPPEPQPTSDTAPPETAAEKLLRESRESGALQPVEYRPGRGIAERKAWIDQWRSTVNRAALSQEELQHLQASITEAGKFITTNELAATGYIYGYGQMRRNDPFGDDLVGGNLRPTDFIENYENALQYVQAGKWNEDPRRLGVELGTIARLQDMYGLGPMDVEHSPLAPVSKRPLNQLLTQPPRTPISREQSQNMAGTVYIDPQSGPANEFDVGNDPTRMIAPDTPYLSSIGVDEMSQQQRMEHRQAYVLAHQFVRNVGDMSTQENQATLQHAVAYMQRHPETAPRLVRYINNTQAPSLNRPMFDPTTGQLRQFTQAEKRAMAEWAKELPEKPYLYPLSKGAGDYRPA